MEQVKKKTHTRRCEMFVVNSADLNTVLCSMSPKRLTLDEAIEQCEQTVIDCNANNNFQCAAEYGQMLAWLKELQMRQQQDADSSDEYYMQVN